MSGNFTFLKGNIETIILCALYKEPTYGYEIAKAIKERTSNKYEIKQPTLYSYLKRLEEDDLIVSYWGETSNGGRRRYYALTKTGRANCEQFISEWQYQRSVLSELVDGTAEGTEITQDEATPLFGRRTRRTKKREFQSDLDEQDEIARRLSELTGASDTSESDDTVPLVETIVVDNSDEVEPVLSETQETEQTVEQQPTVIERIVYVDRIVEKPIEQPDDQQQPVEQTQEDTRARFETNQDNPDDFIQEFNERARVASDRQEPQEGENYQHVLMGVLGDQLDGMEQVNADSTATMYYEDRHAALEDVADSLAREGIRLRIYNHATSIYKSKTLIPFAKVLCQTSWLTYAIAFIIFGILALTSINLGMWLQFVITLSVLIAVPVGFSIYAIIDPTRKEKPIFNFRIAIIVASVVCAIIVLAAVGLSALINGGMDSSSFDAVSKQILIPTSIAVLIPASVAIYYVLYKQY